MQENLESVLEDTSSRLKFVTLLDKVDALQEATSSHIEEVCANMNQSSLRMTWSQLEPLLSTKLAERGQMMEEARRVIRLHQKLHMLNRLALPPQVVEEVDRRIAGNMPREASNQESDEDLD